MSLKKQRDYKTPKEEGWQCAVCASINTVYSISDKNFWITLDLETRIAQYLRCQQCAVLRTFTVDCIGCNKQLFSTATVRKVHVGKPRRRVPRSVKCLKCKLEWPFDIDMPGLNLVHDVFATEWNGIVEKKKKTTVCEETQTIEINPEDKALEVLWRGVMDNNIADVKEAIALGAPLDRRNHDFVEPIRVAISKRHDAIVELLLENRADVTFLFNYPIVDRDAAPICLTKRQQTRLVHRMVLKQVEEINRCDFSHMKQFDGNVLSVVYAYLVPSWSIGVDSFCNPVSPLKTWVQNQMSQVILSDFSEKTYFNSELLECVFAYSL